MRAPSIFIALVCSTVLWAQQPGTLDSSFAVNGSLVLDPMITGDPWDIWPLSDGRLIVSQKPNGVNEVRLHTITNDGAYDPSASLAFAVVINLGPGFRQFYIQEERAIVVSSNDSLLPVAGYQMDGQLDPSFGVAGVFTSILPDWAAIRGVQVNRVMELTDGSKFCVGQLSDANATYGTGEFITKLDGSFTVVESFGSGGYLLFPGTSLSGTYREVDGLNELPGGMFVLALKTTFSQAPGYTAHLRYYSTDIGVQVGPSSGFTGSGFGPVFMRGMAANEAGEILVATGNGPTPRLDRKHFGLPEELFYDAWWNGAGYVTMRCADQIGGFLISGCISNCNYEDKWAIGRRHPDGSRDESFGDVQVPYGYWGMIQGLKPLPDGRLLARGNATIQGSSRRVVVRYHSIPDPRATLSLRMFLGGAYDASIDLMRDDLRQQDLLPALQPYGPPFYPPANGVGPWAVPQHVLEVEGEDAVVDWVWLELINALDSSNVMATRVGLVHRNGMVTSADGHSPIDFSAGAGSYFVRVRHRNHLGVTIADPLALGATLTTVDLTDPATATFGTEAQQEVNGVRMLWPGDATSDAAIKYVGPFNDRDKILVAIGGSNVNAVLPGYRTEDVNLDGVVKYVGTANDRDVILQVLDGSINAVRLEQRP
ncbi:MAG: hypothetical protein IPI81_06075 [Flavobacteriales bacterium]|nr:hypothetical protein [Flavobacteriales bacterium]